MVYCVWFLSGKQGLRACIKRPRYAGPHRQAGFEERAAMRVRTFQTKVSAESLQKMDEIINNWLEKNQVEVKIVTQTFSYENHHGVNAQDPTLITTVWY